MAILQYEFIWSGAIAKIRAIPCFHFGPEQAKFKKIIFVIILARWPDQLV